ncbi:P-loop containing nucleoside triphosphate hydrolase protein, partial [Ganoderma leucocontextum]
NREQARAFRMIAEHSCKTLPDPLHMYIGGVGGTGKSRVIQALTDYFACTNQTRRLRLASYTGIAALNIRGVTLHSALCLAQRKKNAAGSSTRRDLTAMWEGVEYLFIDEISMVGCRLLAQISEALSDAKGITDKPFGGISIIAAGDFAQLPPVGETRLYAWVNPSRRTSVKKNSAVEVIMGKLLWMCFTDVVILDEVMRQKGSANEAFIHLLARLRVGECTDADFELLNTRLLQNLPTGPYLSQWANAPVIVSDNATKDAINAQAAIAFAKNSDQSLHWYHCTDKYRGKLVTDSALQQHLASLHSGQTAHRLGRIPLALGMPVMVAQNFDVGGGIVNGSIGTLTGIRFTTDKNTSHRRLLSCAVRIPNCSALTMPSLNDNEFPVLEDTVDMTFTHPHSDKRVTIKRTQVPIQPAFALTAHKSQGQTFDKIVVDLESCTGTESPYVMLSRATSLDVIIILRSFSKKKIRSRPSEDVRKEFRRL